MAPRTKSERSAKSESTLWNTQRVVMVGIAVGVAFVLTTLYVYSTYLVRYVPIPHLHSLTDRIVFTLRFLTIGLLSVLFSVLHVSNARFLTLASSDAVDRATRILNNSLEQFILNAFNQIIIATYLSEENLRLIPLLNALFITGRIAFWIGYQIAPKYRMFGFTVTFMPTAAISALNLYFLITTNSNYLLDGGKAFGRI